MVIEIGLVFIKIIAVCAYLALLAYVVLKAVFGEEERRHDELDARRRAHAADVREGWSESTL
jgi:hypothetical protein